jgi:hypothetical protein
MNDANMQMCKPGTNKKAAHSRERAAEAFALTLCQYVPVRGHGPACAGVRRGECTLSALAENHRLTP